MIDGDIIKTKTKILTAGVRIWHEDPDYVTARNIARSIGMTHGTVLYHFPEGIKNAVAEHAVLIGDKRIMIQLIANNHKSVQHLTKEERDYWLSCY